MVLTLFRTINSSKNECRRKLWFSFSVSDPNAQLNSRHVIGSCNMMKIEATKKSWARYSRRHQTQSSCKSFSMQRNHKGFHWGEKKWLWKYCHLITRITKQATWEPEPREYRTLDLGNIRLICLFCVYVCITLAITIHLFLKIYYYHILASPCYTMLICVSKVKHWHTWKKKKQMILSGSSHLWKRGEGTAWRTHHSRSHHNSGSIWGL